MSSCVQQPIQHNRKANTSVTCNVPVLLEERLQLFLLKPFNVGCAGDCFFRAVSHQLYGDLCYHLDIRAAGIAYIKDNHEQFVESITEYSWLQYPNNMSIQGTWPDNMIIQAVANQLKLRIVITESNENFRDVSYIEAVSGHGLPDVFLGHIDEYHYVSTVPLSTNFNFIQNQNVLTNTINHQLLI